MTNKTTPLWNDELYELLEFLFWEPQHIGKTKKVNSGYRNWDEVVRHLEKIEVLLNHHFAFFFNLVSQEKKQLILSDLLKISLKDDFQISSTSTRNFEMIIKNFTQPDLLFEGLKNVVYIEMKLGAKSNCEQLLKYLILHLLYEEKTGKIKTPYLLFLGIGDIKKFFQEKVATIEELKAQLHEYKIPIKKRKGSLDVHAYRDRALKLVDTLHIAYANYDDMAQAIRKQLNLSNNETEQKLFKGMIAELEKRHLVSNLF